MYYDINSIRKITEQSIPDLADKIIAGVVDEEQAMNALFKGLRPKLAKELEKRRADEGLWIDAYNSKDIKKLKDYVETYDNEAPEYVGPHLDEAKKLIELIEKDDKEWYAVKLKNTVDSYKHYLDIYDNPAPSYRGKYVDQVKKAIKIVMDKEDWAKAQDENTIEGYARYLSIYDTPDYVGIYVNDAKQAIKALEDEADWLYVVNINTIDSYREYLAKYDTNPPAYKGKYIDEAHQRIEMLLPPPSPEIPIVFPDPPITSPDPRIADDDAWAMAIEFNTIEAYNDYLREYDSQDSASYKGVHVEEAKLAIYRQADEDWDIAVTEHTFDSYERYLSKYNSISKYVGRYVAQAQYALLRLQKEREEEDDWRIACAEDTLTSYKNFVAKYKAMKTSIHLSQAEEKIRELTSPTPNKWIKWLTQALLFIIFCAFFYQLKHHHVWPFNEQQQEVIVEPVDSLQWAIDNLDIPMLTRYAELDSTRAYYPLALALNAQDSVSNINKTLHWLDLVLDPDVHSLHQNIINAIQDKELSRIEEKFNTINPNEKNADRKYLELYKDYVSHFERLASHTPRIWVQYMPIETMAENQIKDRRGHKELRTLILQEWEAWHSKLKDILTMMYVNAKKAYSKPE